MLYEVITGNYSVVKVNQAYNDLKPVWILKPNEKKANRIESEFSSKIKKSPTANLTDTVFEIKLGQIFCKDYCSNFFEGDLEIKVLRSLTTSTIDPITWKASGSYSNAISINLERKYVTYARKNDDRGWVTINAVFDSNWSRDKTQQVFAVYEQDVITSYSIHYTKLYEEYKLQIRAKVAKDFKVEMPIESDEIADIENARKRIVESVGLIRQKVKNGRLLLQHNIEYGFFRNLIGGSLIGLMMSLFDIYYFYTNNNTLIGAVSIVISSCFVVLLIFHKPIINHLGNLYAKRLFQEYLQK